MKLKVSGYFHRRKSRRIERIRQRFNETIELERKRNAVIVIWKAWKRFSNATTVKLIGRLESERFFSEELKESR
jgi:hypothetical protein